MSRDTRRASVVVSLGVNLGKGESVGVTITDGSVLVLVIGSGECVCLAVDAIASLSFAPLATTDSNMDRAVMSSMIIAAYHAMERSVSAQSMSPLHTLNSEHLPKYSRCSPTKHSTVSRNGPSWIAWCAAIQSCCARRRVRSSLVTRSVVHHSSRCVIALLWLSSATSPHMDHAV